MLLQVQVWFQNRRQKWKTLQQQMGLEVTQLRNTSSRLNSLNQIIPYTGVPMQPQVMGQMPPGMAVRARHYLERERTQRFPARMHSVLSLGAVPTHARARRCRLVPLRAACQWRAL